MLRGVLCARFALDDASVTVTTRAELERTLELRALSSGGFNTVYSLPALPSCVLRVSTEALAPGEQRAYYAEVATQRRLASIGLSPRVYAVVHDVEECSFREAPYAFRARIGVVMERYDATLEDVLRSERLTRRVFVEHDGERALVELMLRASRVVSCVDTKAANVVVRLAPVEFAVIDVDPFFCGARRARAACGDFARCLKAGRPASAVHAAVSLLILSLEAAQDAALPWRATLSAMCAAWPVLSRALRADKRGEGMGARTSAMEQIAHYAGIRTYSGVRRALLSARAMSASAHSSEAP